jgi:hypothetical protein
MLPLLTHPNRRLAHLVSLVAGLRSSPGTGLGGDPMEARGWPVTDDGAGTVRCRPRTILAADRAAESKERDI